MPLFIFNFSMKKFFGYSLVFFLIIFIPVPFINIFQEKGLVSFDEGGQDWFTPDELKKGVVENAI